MEHSKLRKNIKPFDGYRYSVWKLRIRNLSNELGVLKVIDNSVPEKANNTKFGCNLWTKKYSHAVCIRKKTS